MADNDAPRSQRGHAAPTTPDPVEIAMEAEASGQAPGGAALAVLRANAALLAQQLVLAKNEVFRNRIKAVRDAAFALAALALVVGVGLFVWSASQARGLVIERFSVPADLAAQGLTGEVVAARFKARLADLQLRTESTRAAETFAEDWSEDIAVEIPSTGIAIGDLQRWLSRTLGRQTVVSGAVWRTPEGLRITVSATRHGSYEIPPSTDMDAALTAAAEDLYRRTQPYRYSVYLLQNDREADRQAHMATYFASASSEERPWALMHMALTSADYREARSLFRQAIALNPHITLAHNNFSAHQLRTGAWEESLAELREAARTMRRPRTSGLRQDLMVRQAAATRYAIGLLTNDFAMASSGLEAFLAEPEFNDSHKGSEASRATLLAGMHRYGEAEQLLVNIPSDIEATNNTGRGGSYLTPRSILARSTGDWDTAYEQLSNLAQMDPLLLGGVSRWRRQGMVEGRNTDVIAPLAEAAAELGRIEEARALIAPTALDCYPCLIVRARAAERGGDRREADRWYAEAVRIGPSLPQAPFEWAMDKLRRGDAVGALALFRASRANSPRWPDPIKGEGDALARLGRDREAVRRYAAAAEGAPRWGALHLAWGDALNRLGRRADAVAKWRLAAGMDLSAADRAIVGSRLARS